jgi:hypothetical protein
MAATSGGPTIYGLMAEFGDPTSVVEAARRAYQKGYRKMDAYTPFPIEELAEALGYHTRGRLPRLVLAGGILGCLGGLALQYWTTVIAYPMNVGGRPMVSWPAWVPVAFETTVLCAALAAVLGMLALNGLPRPHHPVFNAPNFALASQERFFLCLESEDPLFDLEESRRFLEGLNARSVSVVEH